MTEQSGVLPHTEPESSPETCAPPIPRREGLLYLVDRAGGISRSEVQQIAEHLHDDALAEDKDGTPRRTLGEICQEIPGLSDRLGRDFFLSRAIFRYELSELHQSYPETMHDGAITFAALMAGSGSARPLVKELYSLEALSQINVIQTKGKRPNTEIFQSTYWGHRMACQVRIATEGTPLRESQRFQLDRFTTSITA